MLLHQLEGKSCRPEKIITVRVTTSQYEIYIFKISGQNSHLLSQNVFLQSIIYPTKKIVHWNKQHFGSKSCAYGRYTELKELFG